LSIIFVQLFKTNIFSFMTMSIWVMYKKLFWISENKYLNDTSFHVNICTISPWVQLDFWCSCYERCAIKFLESVVINFESYKGLLARARRFMHIYIYTYSFAWKVDFDRLFHISLTLLWLISCYECLFSPLDT
jgi:hypothetical protein